MAYAFLKKFPGNYDDDEYDIVDEMDDDIAQHDDENIDKEIKLTIDEHLNEG